MDNKGGFLMKSFLIRRCLIMAVAEILVAADVRGTLYLSAISLLLSRKTGTGFLDD